MNEWTFLLGQSVSPWKLLLKIIIITLMGGNEKDQAEQKNISQMYSGTVSHLPNSNHGEEERLINFGSFHRRTIHSYNQSQYNY